MHRVEHVMGMPVVVEVRDAEADLDPVYDWLRRVDSIFSTYRADSQISRLNSGELTLDETHPDVRAVVRRCAELRDETDGYFDAGSAPVDPTGLVKGWAVDRAAAILDRAGVREFAVNAGGDIVVRGGPWRVGIQHPRLRHAIARAVEISDLAIATSGEYARGSHIRDPHSGGAPRGVLSVTVTGADLATADAYATAAFAMGTQGPYWTARLAGYEAMTILSDGRVLSTPGFPG